MPVLQPLSSRTGAQLFASNKQTKKTYRQSLGLPADAKMLISSSDGCLATLGDGVKEEGKATITIEDSGAVRVMGPAVLKDEQMRFASIMCSQRTVTCPAVTTNNGGNIFEWFTGSSATSLIRSTHGTACSS